MKVLYSLGIYCFKYLCYFLASFNSKLRQRHKILKQQDPKPSRHKHIHFHCASAGEYEQIAQVIECFMENEKKTTITLSFFSISGIQWAKKKELPYPAYLLPYDTRKDQKKFLETLDPDLFIIAKNELWFNLIDILKQKTIPVCLIAASFKANHFSLKYAFSRNLLQDLNCITSINTQSQQLLEQHQIKSQMLGDPRIDRILDLKQHWKPLDKFNRIDRPAIIYASVHRSDKEILAWIKKDSQFNHIVVPHEVDPDEINYFKSILPEQTVLSKEVESWQSNCILVNEIGILASIYGHSQYAYVGGGFDTGIHNILEAVVHNNIIFLGPKFQAFTEAVDLNQLQCLQLVGKSDNIPQRINTMSEDYRNKCISLQSEYMQQHKDLAYKIYQAIKATI